MNSYLITPKYVLGSDSFYVIARSTEEAIVIAKARIKREGWSASMGWDILQEITTFEEDN